MNINNYDLLESQGKGHYTDPELLPEDMADTSYILFPDPSKDKRFCFLDDPAMEIKALDPNFRIRRNVWLGDPDKTGYGLQILIGNGSQRMKILAYLKIHGYEKVLSTSNGHAIVFDLKRMKGINCTSNRIYCFTNRKQIDRHVGYSLHIEESSELYWHYSHLREHVLKRHPELKMIIRLTDTSWMDLSKYQKEFSEYLSLHLNYERETTGKVMNEYEKFIKVYWSNNIQICEAGRLIDAEFRILSRNPW